LSSSSAGWQPFAATRPRRTERASKWTSTANHGHKYFLSALTVESSCVRYLQRTQHVLACVDCLICSTWLTHTCVHRVHSVCIGWVLLPDRRCDLHRRVHRGARGRHDASLLGMQAATITWFWTRRRCTSHAPSYTPETTMPYHRKSSARVLFSGVCFSLLMLNYTMTNQKNKVQSILYV
jgi:hypothetical protein